MKKFTAILALVIATFVAAEDSKFVTYEGKITGVVCASCKAHITAALVQKLPDVVSVDVKAGETPEAQKLVIITHKVGLTKEAATEALGTYAKNYQILSLARQ
jgi:hypothetical protein